MLYIVTALKPEAQAFVDYYKLQKSKLGDYTLFSNDFIRLIVSGLGVENAMLATQKLIDTYDLTNEDIFINIGICGGSRDFSIGEVIEIGTLKYHGKEYIIHSYLPHMLTCHDTEVLTSEDALVDMDSFGFYEAIRHSLVIEHFHIFKVVSDHFEPQKVTKDGTKSLIFKAIDAINKIISNKEAL